MMAQIPMFEHMFQAVQMGLQDTPINVYQLMEKWHDDTHATTMPPGMPVTAYRMRTNYDPDEYIVDAEVEVQWKPWAVEIARVLPKIQLTHRNRGVCLAASALRVKEINHRLAKVAQYGKQLDAYALDEQESYELFRIVVDVTLSYMNLNFEHIRDYIHKHETASTGGGRKWAEAYKLTPSEWAELFSMTKQNLQMIRDSPGSFNNLLFGFGIRARPDDVPGMLRAYHFKYVRSRIIMFRLALSIVTAFIPDKVGWYRTILKKAEDLLCVQGTIEYAFLRGGQIYRVASDWHQEIGNFMAYDGKVWESIVPRILGPAFNAFMMYVNNRPVNGEEHEGEGDLPGDLMLPSGITFTSIFGTLAMLVLVRNVIGYLILHGDDCNTWDCRRVPKLHFLEFQDGDTLAQYILGLMYALDPNMPRFCGWLKLTVDRADSVIPINLGGDWEAYAKNRDIRQQVAWAGGYFGWFGEATLLEAVEKKITPEDVLAPDLMLENLISEHSAGSDVKEWLYQTGMKDRVVFV